MRNEQPNQIHFFSPLSFQCTLLDDLHHFAKFNLPIPPPSTSFSLYNFSQIGYGISCKSLSLLPPKHHCGNGKCEFVYSLLQTEIIISIERIMEDEMHNTGISHSTSMK